MFRRRAKPLLGTLVEIGAGAATVELADRAINAAFAEIAVLHDLMSFHQAGSELSRINACAVGTHIAVNMRCAEVLQAAQRAGAESEHVFDCSVAAELLADGILPIMPGNITPPRTAAAPCWRIEGDRFVKLAPCLIDLGGIAKGYAVDRAIAILQQYDCHQALVNAGGDMRHFGNEPVIVHLRAADDPGSLPLAISLHNQALATSTAGGLSADGSDHRSAIVDGRTRRRIGVGATASVIAPTCIDADLLTKVVLASDNPHHPMLAYRNAQLAQYCRASAPV